jgi:PAS domain S-box-containing protein
MQGPILVTHHGRPRLVVLSAEEFHRLSEGEVASRPATTAGDDVISDLSRNNFIANMFEGFVFFDAELRVRYANSVAVASAGLEPRELLGKQVDSPEFGEQGTVLAARLRRVLRTGELVQFESKGFFNQHRYFESKAFPFQGGVGVTFSQLTELLDLRHDAEVSRARGQAVDALGVVSQLAVNAMGFIEETNGAFCALVGFSEAQVLGARLVDFVAPPDRHDFAQAMNTVMRGRSEPYGGAIDFLVREQGHVAVRVSAARQMHNDVCTGLAVACMPI